MISPFLPTESMSNVGTDVIREDCEHVTGWLLSPRARSSFGELGINSETGKILCFMEPLGSCRCGTHCAKFGTPGSVQEQTVFGEESLRVDREHTFSCALSLASFIILFN